jgi:outer membrane protein assembly factor BamB
MYYRLPAWLALVLLASVATAPAGDNWPGYRGPAGDGRSDSKNLPTTWGEGENIHWKAAIHGKGWSSPVVFGKQVWVTTADELTAEKAPPPKKGDPPANPVKELSLFAVCVGRDTGKVVHDIKLRTEENPAYCHPFNSYASPTPFVEEGRLYAHFGSHGTWCVDTATGKVLWGRADLKCDHFRGPGSSPVVYGDLLYLILDGYDLQYVTALDKATGKTVWKADRKIRYSTDNGDYKKAYATPALFEVNGRPMLVCPSAECTMAYDPRTGAELWRIAHGGMNGSARPVMGNGLLYLTSGHTGKLLAVKADASPDSSGMLPKDAVVWTVSKGVPGRPSLLLDGGLLYLVNDQGIATCLDAMTGKVVWNERLDGEFSASPVLADGNLYCCNQSGKTFVLAAGKSFNITAVNRLGEGKDAGFMASPAVAGDELYLRTKTHLYSIRKR